MSSTLPAPEPVRLSPDGRDPADAEDLEYLVFSDPWTRGMLSAAFSAPETIALGVRQDVLLSGLALFRVMADEAEILRLAVHPQMRRLGLGSLLLARGLTLARGRGALRAYLEVREGNATALAFYARRGFHRVGRRPGYYAGSGEAALVLARDI